MLISVSSTATITTETTMKTTFPCEVTVQNLATAYKGYAIAHAESRVGSRKSEYAEECIERLVEIAEQHGILEEFLAAALRSTDILR